MVKVSVADGKLLVDPAVFGVVEEIAEGANVAVRIPPCPSLSLSVSVTAMPACLHFSLWLCLWLCVCVAAMPACQHFSLWLCLWLCLCVSLCLPACLLACLSACLSLRVFCTGAGARFLEADGRAHRTVRTAE
jgi:hypothetical protein